MKEKNKRVFEFKELGYKDLEGRTVKIELSKELFANGLFNGARSIEMDAFAKEIHKTGKAEITDQIETELLELLPSLWIHRVCESIKELINKSK